MSEDYWDARGQVEAGNYDAETVRFFDVAHEGAQVRALIPAVEEATAALRGSNPRAVVIVPTDAVAAACAQFVAAEQSAVPVVVRRPGAVLPSFVGALDLVVVVGERAEDDAASQAVVAAARRGARVVALVPPRGPLYEDLPGDALVFPALPTVAGPSPARYIAGLNVVFAALGQAAEATAGYLSGIASELDAEVEQLAPDRGSEVNPARQLRDFVEGAHVLHTGGPIAEVVGAIWAAGGLGGTVVERDAVPLVLERRAELSVEDSVNPADPFFDPFLDGPPLVLSKVILWGADTPAGAGALPHSLAVPAASADAHPLQLIVRAFAATALDPSKGE